MPHGEDERRPRTSRRSTRLPGGRSVAQDVAVDVGEGRLGDVSAAGDRPGGASVPLMRVPCRGRLDLGPADDLLQIGHAGPRAELVEDVVGARASGRACVTALPSSLRLPKVMACVGHVCWQAVTMSPSRTGALLVAGAVLAGHDALDAHRALLHDAELPHGDVRVELHVQRCRDLVVPPVEAAHVVRAVVAAVPRADAAVVDLPVEPLVGAVRREHRADRLARRDLAVLAEHRQERVVRAAPARPPPTARCAASAPAGRRRPRPCRRPGRCSPPGRPPTHAWQPMQASTSTDMPQR